ncbi:hypothetical protein C8Q76DRAFT_691456 [Earliella scabrosa]|nr:hypothetical protein C8Q76DRAFT_691456 [Earliella scabrosa]
MDPDQADGLYEASFLLTTLTSEDTRIAQGFQHIYDWVRLIVRLCGPMVDWDSLLAIGIRLYPRDPDEDDLHPYWDCEKYDATTTATDLFPWIVEYFPKLAEHVEYLAEHADLVAKISSFCSSVSAKTRGDDIGRIKDRLEDLVFFEDRTLYKDKASRGWEHNETAQLLMPMGMLEEWGNDIPGFRRRVKDGQIKIVSGDWPVLFYDLKMRKPDLKTPGFLRSQELLAAARTIFTSQTTALSGAPILGRGRGQPSIACKYRVQKITLHAVVYVAVLLRFVLTSYSTWQTFDGNDWDASEFAYSILNFGFNNSTWVEELMAWWNRELFGAANGQTDPVVVEARKKSAYAIAMANECTGRRQPRRAPRPAAELKDTVAEARADDENLGVGASEHEAGSSHSSD